MTIFPIPLFILTKITSSVLREAYAAEKLFINGYERLFQTTWRTTLHTEKDYSEVESIHQFCQQMYSTVKDLEQCPRGQMR